MRRALHCSCHCSNTRWGIHRYFRPSHRGHILPMSRARRNRGPGAAAREAWNAVLNRVCLDWQRLVHQMVCDDVHVALRPGLKEATGIRLLAFGDCAGLEVHQSSLRAMEAASRQASAAVCAVAAESRGQVVTRQVDPCDDSQRSPETPGRAYFNLPLPPPFAGAGGQPGAGGCLG